MDNQKDNQNFKNEKIFNILEYVKDNFIGLILLLISFFIIYFVDYINKLNIMIYSTPLPVHGLTTVISSHQNFDKKKTKKR